MSSQGADLLGLVLALGVRENLPSWVVPVTQRMRDRAGSRCCRAAVSGACPHAAAFNRIRTGGQGNGHTTAPALPRTCLDHEYRAIHSDVAGAVQEYLALIKTDRCLTV